MNNIYTVVPCRTYKVTATEPCTLTDGHGLTLELTPGTPATFEARTAEIHTTAPVALEVDNSPASAGGSFVTYKVEYCKKVQIGTLTRWVQSDTGTMDGGEVSGIPDLFAMHLADNGVTEYVTWPLYVKKDDSLIIVGWEITVAAEYAAVVAAPLEDNVASVAESSGGRYALKVYKYSHD